MVLLVPRDADLRAVGRVRRAERLAVDREANVARASVLVQQEGQGAEASEAAKADAREAAKAAPEQRRDLEPPDEPVDAPDVQ